MKIAYLCNSFPEPSEGYFSEEVKELRMHDAEVIACSVRRPKGHCTADCETVEHTVYLFPLSFVLSAKATWLCIARFHLISDLAARVVRGPEPFGKRLRTLVHTWLGAYLAARLSISRPDHIHVHHGYFAAWVGMIAARILHAGFSGTLHGSDLLVRADYLDVKLNDCQLCITVSDFNRRYILEHYPGVDPERVLVQRLGVDVERWRPLPVDGEHDTFSILTVGRLHRVKNHGFLLLACRALKSADVRFECLIAGEGEERQSLEQLISHLDLANEVQLLGQVPREGLPHLYAKADVVALTSHSEGIPITLMEAMAMECIVLAPDITGIPELISHGKTGLLYHPNSMEDFLLQLQVVLHGGKLLSRVRHAARQQVLRHFNARCNYARFAESLLDLTSTSAERELLADPRGTHEDPVLQQI